MILGYASFSVGWRGRTGGPRQREGGAGAGQPCTGTRNRRPRTRRSCSSGRGRCPWTPASTSRRRRARMEAGGPARVGSPRRGTRYLPVADLLPFRHPDVIQRCRGPGATPFPFPTIIGVGSASSPYRAVSSWGNACAGDPERRCVSAVVMQCCVPTQSCLPPFEGGPGC